MNDILATPDDVRWASGSIPGMPVGTCGHNCKHRDRRSVANGPDTRRHVLMECTAPQCTQNPAIRCRAWTTSKEVQWGPWRAIWTGVRR